MVAMGVGVAFLSQCLKGMASGGTHGVPAREGEQRRDEPRHEDQGEQQAPAPQGPVLPLPPPVDYGVFMQGLVQAMQTQAYTQDALHAQLEAQQAQERADVWWSSLLHTRFEDGAVEIGWDELVAFDHCTLDEALRAVCSQVGEMEQYLEEKKVSQKRPAAPFQRQERKKAASIGSRIAPDCSKEVSVERHQPEQQQQRQRQDDQGDIEPQLECESDGDYHTYEEGNEDDAQE
ncbi:hypothetical protein Taro_033698 [Colocasia esculenta]|uniref:Uncharacterized protein n=1 Tax=Colocasia esculenta TaxID=4460 RepID=A0A843VUH9_COLES|nr:hypothetical protein [Colocasia esculenta]